jgi:hypothetical protein
MWRRGYSDQKRGEAVQAVKPMAGDSFGTEEKWAELGARIGVFTVG